MTPSATRRSAVVALRDVGPCQVVLATRAGDRRRLVTAFRKSAQSQLAGPQPS
jgi:hypothetical protein